MGDPKKPYTVTDRRRVTAQGRKREPTVPGNLRTVSFMDLHEPLNASFKYVRAQLEHGPVAHSWPRSGHMPDILRGFVISTRQLYAATIALMADKRPQPLVMPAGVLARALVEGIGNLFALLEDPSSVGLFLRDDYRSTHRKTEYYREKFNDRPGYAKEEQMLDQYAQALGLTPDEVAQPEKHLKEWPTPGQLLRRKAAPSLSGQRRDVFRTIHRFWYGSLSGYSHHRLNALQLALYAEEPLDEALLDIAKSATASLTILASLCVLSEVEAYAGFEPCVPLRVAWERARGLDDIASTVYQLRYASLLSPAAPTPG